MQLALLVGGEGHVAVSLGLLLLQVAGRVVVEVLADGGDDDAAGLFVEGEVEAQAVGAGVIFSLRQVGLRVDGAALVGVLVLGHEPAVLAGHLARASLQFEGRLAVELLGVVAGIVRGEEGVCDGAQVVQGVPDQRRLRDAIAQRLIGAIGEIDAIAVVRAEEPKDIFIGQRPAMQVVGAFCLPSRPAELALEGRRLRLGQVQLAFELVVAGLQLVVLVVQLLQKIDGDGLLLFGRLHHVQGFRDVLCFVWMSQARRRFTPSARSMVS